MRNAGSLSQTHTGRILICVLTWSPGTLGSAVTLQGVSAAVLARRSVQKWGPDRGQSLPSAGSCCLSSGPLAPDRALLPHKGSRRARPGEAPGPKHGPRLPAAHLLLQRERLEGTARPVPKHDLYHFQLQQVAVNGALAVGRLPLSKGHPPLAEPDSQRGQDAHRGPRALAEDTDDHGGSPLLPCKLRLRTRPPRESDSVLPQVRRNWPPSTFNPANKRGPLYSQPRRGPRVGAGVRRRDASSRHSR